MESNTNNISSAGLHRLDQRQHRSRTSEEVDVRRGQNALGSLLLSTGLTPSHNRQNDRIMTVIRQIRHKTSVLIANSDFAVFVRRAAA